MNRRNHALSIAFTTLALAAPAAACTCFIITKGASTDGSTIVTYSADSHTLYGELYHTPASVHVPGEMLDIIEWDTGKFLGRIKQVPQTYATVGNMNEHQLVITETTFEGRPELINPKGIIDYGSLIYITLQRAKTAREAIKVINDLLNEYGYHSSGESFSIADPNEAWIFELVGKGPDVKGALWAARKVPDGYISGHANAARIRQFPLDDPENVMYAPDLITFARAHEYFNGKDADFSFADTYGTFDYGAARFCDARVWCMYQRAAASQKSSAGWVTGAPGSEPLPIFIKPDKKLSVHDVMELMRDHFEGTTLDMTKDIGAGPYELPYRWRPLTWKLGDKEYLNERAVSTQQTGFSFVAQSRAWLPDPIGGLLWFGVDDTYSTVYVPMYCGLTKAPHSFEVGNGSFQQYSAEAAFWVFNYVSNFAYLRYDDMIVDIQKVQRELEGRFLADQNDIEQAAQTLYKQSPRQAVDYLTDYSTKSADQTVQRWKKLGEFLLFKYLDGNVKDELGNVKHPGYPEAWYKTVAAAKGESLLMQKSPREKEEEEKKKAKEAAERQGLIDGIAALLKSRNIAFGPEMQAKISEIKELEKLKSTLVRAATVKSAEELMKEEPVASTH